MKKLIAVIVLLLFAAAPVFGQGYPSYIKNASRFIDENGNSYGVPNINGKPRVSAQPYTYEISESNVPAHMMLNKFGMNDDVGQTAETAWTGGSTYTYLTQTQLLTIKSNDANDTAGGDGARTIRIYGQDGSGNEQNETVSLNGATGVQTALQYSRIYRMVVLTAGAYEGQQGTISAANQWGNGNYAETRTGENQTLMALWRVPAGKTFYLTQWWGSGAQGTANKYLELRLLARPSTTAIPYTGVFNVKLTRELSSGSMFEQVFINPITFSSLTDIEIRTRSEVNGAQVSAGFEGWYE